MILFDFFVTTLFPSDAKNVMEELKKAMYFFYVPLSGII